MKLLLPAISSRGNLLFLLITSMPFAPYFAYSQVKDGIETRYHRVNGVTTNKVWTVTEKKGLMHKYTKYYYEGGKESEQVMEGNLQKFYGEWFPGGKKKQEAIFTGPENMQVTHWYANGKVESQQQLKMVNKATGEFRIEKRTRFFENGNVIAVDNYKSGFWHGNRTEYNIQGNKVRQDNYNLGLLEGLSRVWYPDGTLKEVTYYFIRSNRGDPALGRKTTYHSNGKLESDAFYCTQPAGRFLNWYINGSLKSIVDYFTPNGTTLKKGHTLEWLPNGELIGYRNYTGPGVDDAVKINDTLAAKKLFVIYNNPPPVPEGQLLNGKREGLWTTWFMPGVVKSKENYKAGMLHGLYTAYYPNGRKLFEVELTNGIASGKFTMWDASDVKMREEFHGQKKP
jgi:antitoxin component YwqK of YwqJK toxin-antitoxin module